MAARTTVAKVREILTELDSGTVITVHIDTANELTTEAAVTDGPTPGYSSDRLELIERWLAAHFVAVAQQEMRVSAERAGPVGQNFKFSTDLGLNNTIYGQQAIRLDTHGGLSRLEKRSKEGSVTGRVVHVGEDPNEE